MVRKLQIIAFVLACAGLGRIEFGNELSRFHRMDPLLSAGEQAVAEVFGESGARLSVADLKVWQEENAALKAKMGAEVPGDFLTAADLPAVMTVRLPSGEGVILPAGFGGMELDLRAELTRRFNRYAREAYLLLQISMTVLLVLLVAIFRRRFWGYFTPIAAAVLATAGMLGWVGEPINFFQLLCFFILVGLGIDYTIFHRSCLPEQVQSASTRRVVFYSFLTSLCGFGLLAFTSFQVTRSMGMTLGFGLFFAYFFSLPAKNTHTQRGLSPVEDARWSAQKEQSAGKIRLALMWWIYRYLGKTCAKMVTFVVVLCVYPFAVTGRRAVRENLAKLGAKLGTDPAGHGRKAMVFDIFLNFAWSMLDKTDACTLKKKLPRMTVEGDLGWMQGGCFLLSTHVGCIEVLPALRQANLQTAESPRTSPKVHAFQQLGHDALFTRLFLKYLDHDQMTLHAVEDIGVETAVEMKEAIERGEIVLMAGDRPSAAATATLNHPLFGYDSQWPKGVFRFAKLMECPVYAITCVQTGWNAYTVRARRLGEDLLADYVAFLESEVRSNPEQWYQFYPVFAEAMPQAESKS